MSKGMFVYVGLLTGVKLEFPDALETHANDALGVPTFGVSSDEDDLYLIPVSQIEAVHIRKPAAPYVNVGRDAANKLADKLRALVVAGQAMADDYKQLADSGDAGFWKAEDQPEYTNLVSAIEAARKDT